MPSGDSAVDGRHRTLVRVKELVEQPPAAVVGVPVLRQVVVARPGVTGRAEHLAAVPGQRARIDPKPATRRSRRETRVHR